MLAEPNCSKRKCKHFNGIKSEEGDESSERPFCAAFPDGIPAEIAYGTNLHTISHPGDHGIQFET
jgi:hypothetical protein